MNQQITINGKTYTPESIHLLHSDFPFELSREVFAFLEIWYNNKKTIEQQSSGSTGAPKKIRINKQAMIESAKMTGDYFGFQSGLNVLLCLSPRYIAGKMMIVRAMVWDMNLILGDTSSNPVKGLNQRISFAAMVPLQVAKILEEQAEKFNLFETIIIGGSAIPASLENKLHQFKTGFYHTYGMSETMSHIALRKIEEHPSSNLFNPLPGVVLSQDKRGCIVISSERLGIKKLVTNDLVTLYGDQRFSILGRWDEVIISAGIKIHPQLLEQKISQHLHKPLVLIGKTDEIAGEIAVLVIEDQPTTNQIFKYWQMLEKILEPTEIPRALFFVNAIPQLPSGKADRKSLQKLV